MPDGDAAPVIEVVTGDLYCAQCNYNLRTLRRDARCPECRTSVEVSWSSLFNNAAVRSAVALRWVVAGLIVFVPAPLALYGFPLVALVARILIYEGERGLFAALKNSHPDLRQSADRTAGSGGWAVLATIVAWLCIANSAEVVLAFRSPYWFISIVGAAELPAFLNNLCLIGVCRRLAERDGAPGLAKGFLRVGKVLIGAGSTLVLAMILSAHAARSVNSIGIPMVAAALTILLAIITQTVLTILLRRHLMRKG